MPTFFADVDVQLPALRGSAGQPVRRDFIEYELGVIREAFGTRFADLAQPVPGRPDYRQLFSSGRTVRAYSVTGQLMQSGEVEIIGVAIEVGWDGHDLEEPDNV
ncbi:MAG: hypothetical protein H0X35_12485 [Pseudonocardiales bacterium]|nr:hypothetical protein [Pseudonocardiales bacterium]